MPVRTWVACAKDASVPASLELRVCSKFVGRVTGVYSREYNILGKMIADGISFGIFIATGIDRVALCIPWENRDHFVLDNVFGIWSPGILRFLENLDRSIRYWTFASSNFCMWRTMHTAK